MGGNQRNMHVHYNNTVINISRTTETHILTCYRPTMEWNGWGISDAPPLAHDLDHRKSKFGLRHAIKLTVSFIA
jgi:hypothetical protein